MISFYFSANTIIYYLMRREVDATELDDVYVEETDEDFGERAAVAGDVPPSPAADSASKAVVVTEIGVPPAASARPEPAAPVVETPPRPADEN